MTAVKQLWTGETVERFPDRTCRGADEIAGYFEDAFRAIPDFHLTGIHRGPLLGIEATGRKLSIDGMDHFTFRDGVVVSNFVVLDQMQYA